MKAKRITFRLTDEEDELVRNYCRSCELTPTQFLRSLIQLFVLTTQHPHHTEKGEGL